MSIFSSMASMEIPESDIPKLEKIANLSDATFKSLLAAFKAAEPSINFEEYSASLIKASPELKELDLLSIISIVLALYRSKDVSGFDSEKVVGLAARFLSERYSDRFPKERLTLLLNRIKELFDSGNSATMASRAFNVLGGHTNVFTEARIFSDIRPVFGDSVDSVQAAVMVHNLKLSFSHNNEKKEIFLALDNDDIETLKKVIERAEKKTKAMTVFLERSQVKFLDVKVN
jgi:hypothetical protein